MADRVLLIKGISGLGDRILCALTGALYARLSDRRLVIDWSDDAYSTGGINAFHEYFASPHCPPAAEAPDTDSVTPALWRGRLRESAAALRESFGALGDPHGWRRFSIDLSRLDYPEQVAVLWTYGAELTPLVPHMQAAGLPADDPTACLRSLIADTLMLHPRLRSRVDEFRRQHFGERTVGVHVRYTDHRTALSATLRALHRVLRDDASCRVFLCTDNARVLKLFTARYGDVRSTDHWYAATPGRALHHGSGRPDPLRRGEEALIDLYLLAACDDLIVDTSSSFACVATLLTRAPHHRIVDVKRRDKLHPRIRHASNRLMHRIRAFSWGPALAGMFAGSAGRKGHPGDANSR